MESDAAWFARFPVAATRTRPLTASEAEALASALGVTPIGVVEVSRSGARVFVGSFRLGVPR
ncbi:hypothetical protein [Nocardia sp. NPDC047654]|uniref:hypothetical protein n=1 Tax=Nocardia sp. NPDC047654 TaxID=3364314 RepID=UPI0037154A69